MINKEKAAILGYRLKLLRMKHHMRQRELAEKIGYAQSYVSDWECGRKIITTEGLMEIVKVFNISLDYFDLRNNNFSQDLEASSASVDVRQELDKVWQSINQIKQHLQTSRT